MVITKDRIWAQIQQDSEAYDSLPEALKEVLLKEVAIVRNSYVQNERSTVAPYVAVSAHAS